MPVIAPAQNLPFISDGLQGPIRSALPQDLCPHIARHLFSLPHLPPCCFVKMLVSAKNHCTWYFLCLESSPADIYIDFCLTSLKSLFKCHFVTESSVNTLYKMSTSWHCPSQSRTCGLIFNRALLPDVILNLFVVCLPLLGCKITETKAESLVWSLTFLYAMCWSLNHSLCGGLGFS